MYHNFNEKSEEYSTKQKKKIPVWQSPKYEQSREKAIEIIEKYDDVEDSDFWILMNETKTGKMAYTGLIISHNGCLKINDHLDSKFVPSCVTLDKAGYNGSLVYSYCNDKQGIYEVGEVSAENCKNSYPYAMAYKRLFDRVVLKLSKLAYSGVYSDSEADEFKEPERTEFKESDPANEIPIEHEASYLATVDQIGQIHELCERDNIPAEYIAEVHSKLAVDDLSRTQAYCVIQKWDNVVKRYNEHVQSKTSST